MAESFDVIVVGARCAGAPLATLLARAGLSVCVVDKDAFPSDTPSTHAIQPTGVAVLQRLGSFERLARLAPPITRARMVFEDDVASIPDVPAILGAPLLSVRRGRLDEVLADEAARAGADVRLRTTVTDLVREDGRVTGVVAGGEALRARIVVGADGTRSAVARMVGVDETHRAASGRVFVWGYYDGDPTGGELWLGKRDDYAYLVVPTDGGVTVVGACPSIDRRAEVRADRARVYEEGLRAWPDLHARLEGCAREGPIHTMANMHGFFRRSAGPGWALVGDAGHFKDPTPGQGIADALRQVERLADAIVRGFADDALDAEVHAWWRWRDADAWEMYWLAHDLGAAGPTPPLLREAQRRIAADPAMLERTMRIFNHELAPSEVLTPPFVLGTLASALRRGRGQRRAILREAADGARNDLRRRRAAP